MNNGKKALLIIDMQTDFVKEGAPIEVKGIRKNITAFKEFIDFCRDKGLLIVYTRHCYSPNTNPIEAKLFSHIRKPYLQKGSRGWQICDDLKPEKSDVLIDKTRYDAFFKTSLHTLLQKNKVKEIIITGTMTEICCESTARSAMYHNYDLIFCDDLTYTSDPMRHKRTLQVIESHFGKVLKKNEIKKKIKN